MVSNSAINGLITYLSNTVDFMELKHAKQEVRKNPKINTLITQFNQKQDSMYSQKLSQPQLEYFMNDLNKDYEKLSTVPEIKRYFDAGDSFNKLISTVMKEVNTSLEQMLDT